MQFEAASEPSAFVIKQLDFSTHGSNFKSLGKIIWKKDHAILESSATLDNVDLDQFVIGSTSAKPIPVSGELKLERKGSKVAELLGEDVRIVRYEKDPTFWEMFGRVQQPVTPLSGLFPSLRGPQIMYLWTP